MTAELEALLNEMKQKDIGGAVVRVDGVQVCSTIPLNDVSAALLASVSNVSDALMKRMKDEQKELEISFGDVIMVMVPINNHIFCGMIKSREEKGVVLEYAEKAKAFLG